MGADTTNTQPVTVEILKQSEIIVNHVIWINNNVFADTRKYKL